MRLSAALFLATSLAVALPLACSESADEGDDTNGGSSAAGGAGRAGSAGSAGIGGKGGSAGAGGSAGTSTGGAGRAGGAGVSGAGGAGTGGGGKGGAGAASSGGFAGSVAGSAGAGAGGTSGSSAGGAGGVGGTNGGAAGAAGAGGTAGGTAFQPCPTNGDPCRILPFGDSITDGFNVPGGYRMELFSSALGDDHDITYVGAEQNGPTQVDGTPFPRNHEGHSGWKIDQLLDLIPDPAFDTLPHIVLLMIGTNDVNQNDNLAQAPTRLGNLLDQITMTAPNALVVVAKLTPLAGNSNARVMAYNDALPAIVAPRIDAGKHIVLVDQFTGFEMNQLADGVHPNESGYTRMAGVWYAAIESLLP